MYIRFSIIFLLFIQCAYAQTDAEKSDKKLVDPLECPTIHIDIKNNQLTANSWDEGVIHISMEIQTNVPKAILSELVKAGRYKMDSGKDGDVFVLRAPNLEKVILIDDEPLLEEISIQVFTPGFYAEENGMLSKDIDEEVIAARSANEEQARKMLKEMKKIKEKINWQVSFSTTSNSEELIDPSRFKIVVDGVQTTLDKLH